MKDKKENVPKIRFPGFTEPWEQHKCEEIASFSKGNGYSKSDLLESGTPIILYGRLYTKYEFSMSEVDTFATEKGGSIFSEGNEVIVPASGETAEDIARAAAVVNAGIMLGGDLNIIKPNDMVIPEFLALNLSNGEPQRDLAKRAQGKSIVHVHNSDIQDVKICYPTLQEQNRITEYFKGLDYLITLHQRKLDDVKKMKKGLLQKMFPKKGEKVPEIRFPGFTEDWEQRKFGELIDERREKTLVEDEDILLSCAIDGMYLNSELFSHFRGSSNKGYLKIKMNDMILSAQNLHLGNCNINRRFEHGIISPAYKVYELIESDPSFMQAWIKADATKKFFLKATTEGASVCRKNIVWSELYKQKLSIPKLDEQKKIGQYFTELDNLITLHQRKLDDVKELKKGLLQQMFV